MLRAGIFLIFLSLPLPSLAAGDAVPPEKMTGIYGTPYNALGKWVCTKTEATLVEKLSSCRTEETATGPAYACTLQVSPNKDPADDYYFFTTLKACKANLTFLAVD